MKQEETNRQVDIQRMWEVYAQTRDIGLKNELTIYYLPLVKRVLTRMMPTYRKYCDFDDLLSVGTMGLMEAIERFDVSKNIKFETFVVKRIRGKVLDYLRKEDWASVSLRRKIKEITSAYTTLEMELGRSVTEEEVAQFLHMDVEKLRKVCGQSYMFNLVHFESALLGTQNDAINVEDMISDNKTDSVAEILEQKELKEIAQVLGLSESRVSQIHSKVLMKLAAQLEQGDAPLPKQKRMRKASLPEKQQEE